MNKWTADNRYHARDLDLNTVLNTDVSPLPTNTELWPITAPPCERLPTLGKADSALVRLAVKRKILPPGTILCGVHFRRDFEPLEPRPLTATSTIERPAVELIPDLILYARTASYAVEVKPAAGAVAVGQALAYAAALQATKRDDVRVLPAILTDLAKAYTPELCKRYGVTLWEIGQLLFEPPPYPT